MESEPIFYDPQGKRRGRMSRVAALVSSIAAVTSTLFILVLCFTIPSLNNPAPKLHKNASLLTNLPASSAKTAILFNSRARQDLLTEIERSKSRVKRPPDHVEKIV